MQSRLERARRSLDGLSVGDAFGERFFLPDAKDRVARRVLPRAPWTYTDDTVMAMAIVEILEKYERLDQDALAKAFARRYRAEPQRGYGAMAHFILSEIGAGVDWRALTHGVFDGMGSMGNGGAMRVAPLGAYYFDDISEAADSGRRSGEVTHGHPEGQAGATAVAVAAAYVGSGGTRPGELFETVLGHTPEGETRVGIRRAAALALDSSVDVAVRELGNGSDILAQDTVPFAVWCAARHLGQYEEAMWATVSGLGDRDTTCAIVGGILASSPCVSGPPRAWLAAREPLAPGA